MFRPVTTSWLAVAFMELALSSNQGGVSPPEIGLHAALRKEDPKKWTQSKVAKALGVEQQRVSDWLSTNTGSGNGSKPDARVKILPESKPAIAARVKAGDCGASQSRRVPSTSCRRCWRLAKGNLEGRQRGTQEDGSKPQDADPQPLEQNVWHPYYIDALAVRYYDANTDNNVVDHYYTHDANFNVTAVTDDTGTVLERYQYDPYGELQFLNSSFGDISATTIENTVTYTGQRFEVETGLYYYRARYYHATLGRFVNRDPIGYSGGDANLYGYVRNNPVAFSDPVGLAPNREGATNSQHLIDRICELEADACMTDDEILKKIRDEHTSNENRYFYTDKYGWVDMRHFNEAAATAHGWGPVGSEISEFGGFLYECWQWLHQDEDSYQSGFSPEDLPSNAAGANFGEDYVGHYGSLCIAIKEWMKANGGRPKDDPKAGFSELPATDPALPGGADPGSNSSNDPIGGNSNSNTCKSSSPDTGATWPAPYDNVPLGLPIQ